jgi:YD repeat-containing protein
MRSTGLAKRYVFNNVDYSDSFVTCGFPATVEYDYDDPSDPNGIGRLAVVDDPSGSTWFQYDVRGRTVSVNKGVAVLHDPPMADAPPEWALFLYSYDAANHVVSVRYPDGEIVAHGYDSGGRLNRLESDNGTVYLTDLTYDVFGRRRRIAHGNATVDERIYSTSKANAYRLTSITAKLGSGRYFDLAYTAYTRTGLITHIEDRLHPSSSDELSSTVTYEYDGLGRLVRATGPNLPAAPNDTYAYDALGNMTRKEEKTFSFSSVRPHQVTAINGSTTGISHDQNGSRTGTPARTYAYDPEGRLASIDGGAVSFQYDYTGRQVAKYTAAGAHTTRYFNELAESRDGRLIKYYLAGDLRIASLENANWQVAAAAVVDATTFASAPSFGFDATSVVERSALDRGCLRRHRWSFVRSRPPTSQRWSNYPIGQVLLLGCHLADHERAGAAFALRAVWCRQGCGRTARPGCNPVLPSGHALSC